MSDQQQRGCALVTGSARGIGAAIATQLAADGFDLVLNYASDSSAANCRLLAASLEERFGVKTLAIQADVADFAQAKALVDAANGAFGGIEVLVNNAGITRDGLLMRMKEEQFDQVIDVNLKGVFNMIRHAVGPMCKRRRGRIINITSISGILGNAGQANYSASKAGVIGLTKSCAREVAARGITVNAVAPGFVETDMVAAMKPEILEGMVGQVPLKRLGSTEDVASLVSFLASDKAGYITGQVIQVDGGLGM